MFSWEPELFSGAGDTTGRRGESIHGCTAVRIHWRALTDNA
jgi:hypothetical protein